MYHSTLGSRVLKKKKEYSPGLGTTFLSFWSGGWGLRFGARNEARAEGTSNKKSETRDPRPETRDPKPESRKPEPVTRSLKPEIRNAKPENSKTRSLQPETRKTKHRNPKPENPKTRTPNPEPPKPEMPYRFNRGSVSPSIRPISTRCCLTMTYVIQVCSNFRWARVFIINTRRNEIGRCWTPRG